MKREKLARGGLSLKQSDDGEAAHHFRLPRALSGSERERREHVSLESGMGTLSRSKGESELRESGWLRREDLDLLLDGDSQVRGSSMS